MEYGVNEMLTIRPLEETDVCPIVEWNAGKDEDFLRQWTGCGYEYPITERQIMDRIRESGDFNCRLYKIIRDGVMIGTIELMKIDPELKKAAVGRFLLNPGFTGKGYGTEALKLFVDKVFRETDLTVLRLCVFSFNKNAYRCYEKAGFQKVGEEVRPNG